MIEFIYVLIAAGVWIKLEMVEKEDKKKLELLGKIFFSWCWPFIVGLLLIDAMEKTKKDE